MRKKKKNRRNVNMNDKYLKQKEKEEKNGKELKQKGKEKLKVKHDERESNIGGRRARVEEEDQKDETTFGFPILDAPTFLGTEVKMKNIPPSILPIFYGIAY
jgi:hypothetical protein